jgi:CRP-like cAMP-binding protein
MPYPIQSEAPYEPALPTPEEQQATNLQALRSISGLANLPIASLEKILDHSEVQDYAKRELVLEADTPLSGLYLILEGEVQLLTPDYKGKLHPIGVLSPGEFFGEKSSLLSDQTSDGTVVAAEDLRLLLIPTEILQMTLQQSGRLAQELGAVMEIRRRAVQAIQDAA